MMLLNNDETSNDYGAVTAVPANNPWKRRAIIYMALINVGEFFIIQRKLQNVCFLSYFYVYVSLFFFYVLSSKQKAFVLLFLMLCTNN